MYYQLSSVCLLTMVLIIVFVVGRNIAKKRAYKPRKSSHYILVFILMFLIGAISSKAQVILLGGAGMSNKYFSAELQAGYRFNNATLTAGYIALPEDNQPALFNVRAGYVIAERVHVYGGYVKVMYSMDDKSRNSNTWQVGAQYLFCYYDRGSFYFGGNYTGNKMISAHVGMTFQLSKGFD